MWPALIERKLARQAERVARDRQSGWTWREESGLRLPARQDFIRTRSLCRSSRKLQNRAFPRQKGVRHSPCQRSEEHTSELQSRQYLVCRLLLEKKNI